MRLESLNTDNGAPVLCSTLKKLCLLIFSEVKRNFCDFAVCTQLEHIDIDHSIDFESLLQNLGQLRTIKLKDELTQDEEDAMKRKGYRMSKKRDQVKFCLSI